MKLQKSLLLLGGSLNVVFVLFHVWLGWRIHHWPVAEGVRVLLEMLNGGGTLLILFLAVTSLAHAHEVLTSPLGRSVLVLAAALYLLRGFAEVLIAPHFSPLIFATCAFTGGLYAALLFLRRVRALNAHPSTPN